LQAVLDIVLPVFGLVLLGYLIARTPLLTPEGIKGITNFVFFVAIPVMLFRSVSSLKIPASVDPLLPVAYFSAAFVVYGSAMLLARSAFRLGGDQSALFAMGSTYSNMVLLGLPLVYLALGDEGLIAILLIIAVHSLALITVTTIMIELSRGKGDTWRRTVLTAARALTRNPVILGLAAGLVWGATGLELPKSLERLADMLKAAAPPAALFAVGASLAAFRLLGDPAQSAAIIIVKLLVLPAAAWASATYVFGLSPLNVAVATLAGAMPTGVNVFLLASAYDTYRERSATAVVISTALAVITVGLLIALFAPAT
jgi:malonate transporter